VGARSLQAELLITAAKVRKRLLIRQRTSIGQQIYGQIEIERGGRINGEAESREGFQEW
jgi:hypothetical protein